MIMDKLLEFADAQSVVSAAGTVLLGNVIDMQVARDLGQSGRPVYFVITVDTEVITGGVAGTIKFQLVSDAQAAIAVDGSATVHYDTGTIVTGAANANSNLLNVGSIVCAVALPLEGNTYEEFLGVLYTVATTATTAGAVNAFLTLDPPTTRKVYPDAVN